MLRKTNHIRHRPQCLVRHVVAGSQDASVISAQGARVFWQAGSSCSSGRGAAVAVVCKRAHSQRGSAHAMGSA